MSNTCTAHKSNIYDRVEPAAAAASHKRCCILFYNSESFVINSHFLTHSLASCYSTTTNPISKKCPTNNCLGLYLCSMKIVCENVYFIPEATKMKNFALMHFTPLHFIPCPFHQLTNDQIICRKTKKYTTRHSYIRISAHPRFRSLAATFSVCFRRFSCNFSFISFPELNEKQKYKHRS